MKDNDEATARINDVTPGLSTSDYVHFVILIFLIFLILTMVYRWTLLEDKLSQTIELSNNVLDKSVQLARPTLPPSGEGCLSVDIANNNDNP